MKRVIFGIICAGLLLAGCTTINGMFTSLQSGKNYIGDAGIVFHGFQQGFLQLCQNRASFAFCSDLTPKMKAADVAAINAYQIALDAASVANPDPTKVGDLAGDVARSILDIQRIVQLAQARSGRKADALNTAVVISSVTFTVAMSVATEIFVLNAKGATIEDLQSILDAVKAEDAKIQAM